MRAGVEGSLPCGRPTYVVGVDAAVGVFVAGRRFPPQAGRTEARILIVHDYFCWCWRWRRLGFHFHEFHGIGACSFAASRTRQRHLGLSAVKIEASQQDPLSAVNILVQSDYRGSAGVLDDVLGCRVAVVDAAVASTRSVPHVDIMHAGVEGSLPCGRPANVVGVDTAAGVFVGGRGFPPQAGRTEARILIVYDHLVSRRWRWWGRGRSGVGRLDSDCIERDRLPPGNIPYR